MAISDRTWWAKAGSPSDEIADYARTVLREFAGTRVWDAAAQLHAASVQAAPEYAGRFLIERLQNAHDTHPADLHEGRISIVVDADEGERGTVYVANGGMPFAFESVTALCKLARSLKLIGAGIGHKGVGFRSVLSVCSWPEIYSAARSGPVGNLETSRVAPPTRLTRDREPMRPRNRRAGTSLASSSSSCLKSCDRPAGPSSGRRTTVTRQRRPMASPGCPIRFRPDPVPCATAPEPVRRAR